MTHPIVRGGRALFTTVSIAALLVGGAAFAQDAQLAADTTPTEAIDEIIIQGIAFRNRNPETVAPVMSYDLEYFQRFEPTTAGDAIRRVPSVQFLSDVLESDGARLRGLDPGYTQILINGEKVPGGEADRSFFVDRIPAELIERVEVVRSHSANRSGDAVAGALNIVLRSAASLNGGYVRAGGTRFDDNTYREALGAVYGGQAGPGRILVGASVQGRRNPKEKLSLRYDEPDGTLDNSEVQHDLRTGRDYSANGSYVLPMGDSSEFEVSGLYVRTDRFEDEDSYEYVDGIATDENTDTFNDANEDIKQDNWSTVAKFTTGALGGKTQLKVGYAKFLDNTRTDETEFVYLDDDTPFPDDDAFETEYVRNRISDGEFQAQISHAHPLGSLTGEIGLQYQRKNRDISVLSADNDGDIDDTPAPRPSIPGTLSDYEAVPGGLSDLKETRLDPYIMLSGEAGPMKWEAGLRYETTDMDIIDLTAPAATSTSSADYSVLLPSAHIRWNLTPQDRITVSAARTLRRPNFNDITPAVLEEEIGDSDFVGNPALKPEKAWGFDLGYEHYLGNRGVTGINFFYRDITDVIEIANTGEEGSEGPGTFVLTRTNTGKGKVWGVEFDLSTPLSAINLNDTGIFFNASWLDSKIVDHIGKRRFNDQSDYVLSTGFIQDFPAWGASFGASYRKQGKAFGRVVAEEVYTRYGADLEAFVEKRIGANLVVRFTGSNLLNSSKDEVFHKFDNEEDQIDRDYDEYEVETEKSGPVFKLVARYAF